MGRYDDIDPDALREHLVRVARLILDLDDEGALLREAPRLQKVLGDLRQRLFAYEIRSTANLDAAGEAEIEGDGASGDEELDPSIRDSLRIVKEAVERAEELRDELERGPSDEDDEEA